MFMGFTSCALSVCAYLLEIVCECYLASLIINQPFSLSFDARKSITSFVLCKYSNEKRKSYFILKRTENAFTVHYKINLLKCQTTKMFFEFSLTLNIFF